MRNCIFKHEIQIDNKLSLQTKQQSIQILMRRSFQQPRDQRQSVQQSFLSNKNNVKSKHLIQYLTEEIGLTQRAANILVKVHQCTTKPEVLELLISDNDVYSHIFIPSTESSLKCQICDCPESSHTIFDLGLIQHALEEHSVTSLSQDFILTEQQSSQSSPKELCEICYIKYYPNEMAFFSESKHSLCITCLGSFVDQKITSMQIESILCPHCNIKLNPDVIKKFASQKVYAVYEQFLKNAEIQKNPNLMWCPNPKCSVVISINKKNKTFSCPKCAFKICSKCKNQAHSGKSCNSFFQNQIKSWENNSSIQRCKKCSSIVQKISGCNHMSCTVCGHEWCWLCGANYSQRHFNPLNPFGCAGMQNRDGIGTFRIWAWRVVLFLLIIITVPIVFPFALLFSGPFVSIEFFYKKVQYDNSRMKKFLAVVVGFVLGIMFDPLIWIGLIVVFAPKFFRGVREYFRSRRRRNEISENRLTERLINDAIVNSDNIVFQNAN